MSGRNTRVGGAGMARLAGAALGVAAACMLAACPAAAQVPVDDLETWSSGGLAGWETASPRLSLSNPGGYLDLGFAAQSAPLSESGVGYTVVDSGVVVTNLSFRLRSFGSIPSSVRLYIHSSASGRHWYVQLASPRTGEWADYSIPLVLTAGWSAGPGGSPAAFAEDSLSVDLVGLYVRRGGGAAEQSVGMDDFRLQGHLGDGSGAEDRDGDGIPDAWEEDHGFLPDDASDGAEDADSDGMSNYAEFRAGTNPHDDASRFSIESLQAEPGPNGGFSVRWSSEFSRTYSVWAAPGVTGAYESLESGVTATPPVNEYRDVDASGLGPRFYRIEVE